MNLISVRFLAVICVLAVGAGTMISSSYGQESWTYGGITYKLPVPRDEVVIPADIPETHTVVSGDTLWDITARYLNDPFLWPLIWDANMDEISNPHLIYPGQEIKLLASAGGPMPTEEVADAEEGMPEEGEEEELFPGARVTPDKLPVVGRSIMIKSGYIMPKKAKGPSILDFELPIFDGSERDICYIDKGSAQGISAGDRFYVIRNERKSYHPVTDKFLGWLTLFVGEGMVLCTQENTSTVLLEKSFTSIHMGDVLIPYYEMEVPVLEMKRGYDICTEPSGQIPGYIADCEQAGLHNTDSVLLAEGAPVYLDVGSQDNVVPGDVFVIYSNMHAERNLPRIYAGKAAVLKTQEKTATAFIIESRLPIFIGDSVQLMK